MKNEKRSYNSYGGIEMRFFMQTSKQIFIHYQYCGLSVLVHNEIVYGLRGLCCLYYGYLLMLSAHVASLLR